MRIGYGYSFSITPLHLVKAYASLANDGFQVNPTILKKITEEKENGDKSYKIKGYINDITK